MNVCYTYENTFTEYPPIVGITDLCKMLGIGRNSAYELVNNGTIKSIRVGKKHRIPKVNVIIYLNNNVDLSNIL